MAQRLPIGKIVRAHGMKGEVKVLPYLIHTPEVLFQIPLFYLREKQGFSPLRVESIRPAPKGGVVVKFQEVKDRDEAESLRGRELYIDRHSLPPKEEDEYYVFELVGLEVRLTQGTVLGQVVGLMPVGPYELLEVRLQEGHTVYIPLVEDIVEEINLEEGFVKISPPAGLLESQLPPPPK